MKNQPLALFLLLICCPNSIALPVTAESSVGIYLETVTHDPRGNTWVGGSVWLLQGLLLRINSAGVTVITPPKTQTVQQLLFTTKNVAWMVADYKGLFQSVDGGLTWREVLRSESNLTDIAFPNERAGWVVGWDGIIYHTDDGGRSWNKQTSGTEIDLRSTVFVDAMHGWAMGWNMFDRQTQTRPRIFLRTTDAGKTWLSIGGPSLSLHSITFFDAQNGWAVIVDDGHDANLARTNDGGVTWVPQVTRLLGNCDTVLFLNRDDGWTVGDGILKTNDGGATWLAQPIPRRDRSYGRISFSGTKAGAAIHVGSMDTLTAGDILRRQGGGTHWQAVSNRWVRPTTNRVYREKFGRRKAFIFSRPTTQTLSAIN